MKSPRVYKNFTFYGSTAAGLITSLIVILTLYKDIEFWQALGFLITITGALSLMGWILRTSTIYTRMVDRGVEPDEPGQLIVNKIYWLNGEFEAKYLYKYGFTGELVFEIEGLEGPVAIYPGLVRLYISASKEVG
jgi:hypothetical protein